MSSTPLLDLLLLDRPFFSVECDPKWYKSMTDQEFMKVPNHGMILYPNAEDAERILFRFSIFMGRRFKRVPVVFVDNGPGFARHKVAKAWQNFADIIICHDTESPWYEMETVLPHFKYRYDYMKLKPWTTAVSDVIHPAALVAGKEKYTWRSDLYETPLDSH